MKLAHAAPAPRAARSATRAGPETRPAPFVRDPTDTAGVPLRPRSSCACGGGCPRCQAKSALTIGAPDDAYEREADAVAARVMGMAGGTGSIAPATSGLQRKCAACEKEDEETLLRPKAESSSAAVQGDVPAVPSSVNSALSSPGQPLDFSTRAFFEPRLGHDFSGVRVHANAAAGRSARDVNALAYTVGRDIVFGTGKFAPGTHEGRHLLAHELTHVVQQERGSVVAPNSPSSVVQRSVRPGNVSCRTSGLTGPDLTGDEVVAAIEAADAGAIALAQQAEDQLTAQLSGARAGDPVDAGFDNILQEELGLTLTSPAQFGLIQQQIGRFRRVRETLESGYLRYLCRGGTVTLVGCSAGTCGQAGLDFAFTCQGNRLVVLCQLFWDEPDERPGTLLHEPFHIWFTMARHATNALKRADSFCFEAFARRLGGESPAFSCVDHTAG